MCSERCTGRNRGRRNWAYCRDDDRYERDDDDDEEDDDDNRRNKWRSRRWKSKIYVNEPECVEEDAPQTPCRVNYQENSVTCDWSRSTGKYWMHVMVEGQSLPRRFVAL